MWLAHIQLLDSAFPIGTFSHSFGLETLIQEGYIQTSDDLRQYCEAMLWGAWAPCEALAVKAAYVWAHEAELWQLDRALHSSRVAAETREGQRKIGKRLREIGHALHPDLPWPHLDDAVRDGRCIGSFPIVYGWMCHGLGVPLEDAATGLLYGCLSGCLNNAVRAMRLGQTQGQVILVQMLPAITNAWHHVQERDPWDFETSVPGSEIAGMRHEWLYSRLFMS